LEQDGIVNLTAVALPREVIAPCLGIFQQLIFFDSFCGEEYTEVVEEDDL
jgi:hypothetical protein